MYYLFQPSLLKLDWFPLGIQIVRRTERNTYVPMILQSHLIQVSRDFTAAWTHIASLARLLDKLQFFFFVEAKTLWMKIISWNQFTEYDLLEKKLFYFPQQQSMNLFSFFPFSKNSVKSSYLFSTPALCFHAKIQQSPFFSWKYLKPHDLTNKLVSRKNPLKLGFYCILRKLQGKFVIYLILLILG